MFFDHLAPDMPDCLHLPNKVVHPLLAKSLGRHAQVTQCTNQRFARAANLLLDTIPMWDATAFGKDGKIMDSWESSRHCVASASNAKLYVPASSLSSPPTSAEPTSAEGAGAAAGSDYSHAARQAKLRRNTDRNLGRVTGGAGYHSCVIENVGTRALAPHVLPRDF